MEASIIVMAYNRRKYLLNALNSAIKQNIERSRYEILLIKNFAEEVIDEFCISHGIHTIKTENVSIGEYILTAVNNSSGDILFFLDDDDAFAENKLEVVLESYKAHPDIVYLRNSWSLIDSEGKHIDQKRKKRQPLSHQTLQILSTEEAVKRIGLDFRWNMSCISVKKEIFNGFESFLPSLIAAQDLALFYMAASYNKVLAGCNASLTFYRVHENSMTKIKGPNNDALREYNSLLPLENLLSPGFLKEDLNKTLDKLYFLSIWDGSSIKKSQAKKVLGDYLSHEMYNFYDIKVLIFIFFQYILISLGGANTIKKMRQIIDPFWSYEENF